MAVQAYSNPNKFPGATALVSDPPSLAWNAGGTATGPNTCTALPKTMVPDFTDEPWATDLPGEDLIVTSNTDGNTGTFSITAVQDANNLTVTEDPGVGFPTVAYCTPSNRSGIDDLALRLQGGYTDANGDPHAAIPSTIIGGVIITEAATTDAEIAAY